MHTPLNRLSVLLPDGAHLNTPPLAELRSVKDGLESLGSGVTAAPGVSLY
jgi:hypothetical protein